MASAAGTAGSADGGDTKTPAAAPLKTALAPPLTAAAVTTKPLAPAPAPAAYLIVNADDLGYASERDAGIIKSIQSGIVTSTSVRDTSASRSASNSEPVLDERNSC